MAKLKIKSEKGDTVDAYFNPKEFGVDKSVPWQQQKDAKGESPPVEFTTGAPKTMSFELLCDLFEKYDSGGNERPNSDRDVYSNFVSKLEKFVSIDDGLKRPPMVEVSWSASMPVFKGVVESMNVKYTMFLEDGTPCRCTANLKFKQADSASVGSAGGGSAGANSSPTSGTTVTQGTADRPDQATAAATGNPNPTSQQCRDTAAANDQDNMRDLPQGGTYSGGS
jgi:hypothetical protein